ncbi:MAG: aminoglycoside phosphotransferase family protein [Gammaproteobacteria bacterium]
MLQTDARLGLIQDWLSRELGLTVERIEPASVDASFRRYFRAWASGTTRIVMDAPPEKEDVGSYLKVTRLLESVGMHVPHVHEADESRGLLLLEDLGHTHYLSQLKNGGDPEALYRDALGALANLQVRGREAARELAPYDRAALLREMKLMPEWFAGRHLGLSLTPAENALLERTFGFLIDGALAQPQVFVHRDYHSRNLMVLADRNPGVLDFQDALRGPIGYDLVSLLKDCYVAWPRERVERWLREYRAAIRGRGMNVGSDEREFFRWFDLIGVQRHIKVLGIFARLWYRDGKPGYLPDLPLTLAYVRDTAARYVELRDFSSFVERCIVPGLPRANERALAQTELGA